MASIQVRPPTSFSIRTSTAGSGGSSAATVTAGTSAPALTVGNLWFDTNTNFLKVYDGANWDALGLVDHDNDGRFEFESTANGVSALTSGLLAQFSNNNTSIMSLSYDGVIKLASISGSAPAATAGGIYNDGDDWYLGVS
jgi:hypothetical protein